MADAGWKRRLTTPEIGGVRWAAARPDRLAVVSTEGGRCGVWAWDRTSGRRRQVSGDSVVDLGFTQALMTPDGRRIAWWHDANGDELGRWMTQPFRGGATVPLLPGVPDGWYAGISLAAGAVAMGVATEQGQHAIYVGSRDAPARLLYASDRPAGVGTEDPPGLGGLSADGRLLCIRHSERSDIVRPAARILDPATGDAVAELSDPDRAIVPLGWAPSSGDERLVVLRALDDRMRPWMWDVGAGIVRDIGGELAGDVAGAWWYPDGRSLLLHHELDASPSLLRLDLASGAIEPLVERGGTIGDAGVRPDGTVWYRYEDGATRPTWTAADGSETLRLPGPPAPEGSRWSSLRFRDRHGIPVQAWLLRPPGRAPHPTVLWVHGGPDWHVSDRWDPAAQAYVDNGFAVLAINYRGSTGYGRIFRDALQGNLGFPESEDLVDGLDHAVALGIVDASRVFLEGWSHGGFLATLNAGLHPDRWKGVIAGIPVGDIVAAHYESAPPLRAWDDAVMGGDPMTLPERYHERNPMTYVDRVRAPVLLIAGEHDTRCPLGQVMVYAHALRRRGRSVEVHLYPYGHHAPTVEERVRQVELILGFMHRCLAAG